MRRLAAGSGHALPGLFVGGLQSAFFVRRFAACPGHALLGLFVGHLEAAAVGVRGFAARPGHALARLLVGRGESTFRPLVPPTGRSAALAAGRA